MGEVISFDEALFPAPVLEIDLSADPQKIAQQIVGQFPTQRNDAQEISIIARVVREFQEVTAKIGAEYSAVCLERDRLKQQLVRGK